MKRRYSYKLFLSACALIGLSASQSLQAQTLADAMAQAYAYNPVIEARKSEVDAATEVKAQARAGYLPSIEAGASAGIEYDNTNVADGSQTRNPLSVNIGASQLLYDWGRTNATVASAQAGVDRTVANLASAKQTALVDAVRAYMDVLRDLELVELAENNVRVLSNQLEAAQDRFDVGEVTRTDVSQATARLALAKSNLSIRRGELAQSRQSYIRATGAPATNLQPAPPLPDVPDSLEDAIAIAMDNDPNLQSAQFAIEAAEANVKTAQKDLLPRFSLDGNMSSTSEQSQENVNRNRASVSVNMNAPIFLGGRNYASIRRARAEASARRAELQDAARLVREATAIAWEQLKATQSTIGVSKEQIKAAEVAFEGVKEETKVGFRTTLDLLDAEQELLQARTNLVSAERDEQVAAYELLQAIGMLTPAHLGLDVVQDG